MIESISAAGGDAVTIKSHHNVVGLPDDMALELVERLRELFKDEVRDLGRELGLPDTLVGRHPFTEQGLAICILGDMTPEKLDILQEADAIYPDAIRKTVLYYLTRQPFDMLLCVKTVGVMGDAQWYEYFCSLQAVKSSDGMKADNYGFDRMVLSHVANQIVN